jgi:hypothetical protein
MDSTPHTPTPPPRAGTPRLWLGVWAVLALAVVVAAVAQPRIEAHYLQRAGAADTATMRLATEVCAARWNGPRRCPR